MVACKAAVLHPQYAPAIPAMQVHFCAKYRATVNIFIVKRLICGYDEDKRSYMIASIIYAIGGFIEALVGLRFVGANPDNALVSWIYAWSTPFVAPFSGIFGQDATVVSGVGAVTTSVFDWTALIALIIIGIVVGIVGSLLGRHYAVR